MEQGLIASQRILDQMGFLYRLTSLTSQPTMDIWMVTYVFTDSFDLLFYFMDFGVP